MWRCVQGGETRQGLGAIDRLARWSEIDTKAKPEIWENMDDFKAKLELIEIEVLRYRPEQDKEPFFQTYQVPFTDDMSVLQGLQHIKDHLDGSLSFRWSCRMAICGSCGAARQVAELAGYMPGLGAVVREVASPTFAILHEYGGADGTIRLRHLDLYRLRDRAAELEVLGLPGSVAGAPASPSPCMRSAATSSSPPN